LPWPPPPPPPPPLLLLPLLLPLLSLLLRQWLGQCPYRLWLLLLRPSRLERRPYRHRRLRLLVPAWSPRPLTCPRCACC
jgi:hypothetical protein